MSNRTSCSFAEEYNWREKMPEPIFDVFISSARDNVGYAAELAGQLAARGVKVWYSREESRNSPTFADELGEALRRSRFMVMVLSPSYLSDSQANFELGVALVSYEPAGRVLPIYLREIDSAELFPSIRRLTGFRAEDLT